MRLTIVRLILATVSFTALTELAGPPSAQSSIASSIFVKSRPSPLVRNRDERFEGRGGAIVFPPCKFKINRQPVDLSPSLEYASNSLGKKHQAVDVEDGQAPFPGAPMPSGFTLDWVGVLAIPASPITFNAANANFTISGTAIDPETSYYLYVYTNYCGEQCGTWVLVSATPLGMPANGSLVGPSPLQNGFVFGSQSNVMDLVLVH